MRVLLLAGGGTSTATVEPLEQLLQTGISHGKGDSDDLFVRYQVKVRASPRPSNALGTLDCALHPALTLLCPKFACGVA